jgi:peptidoglycan/xylan/chitin deacetylase (PgdA/CDA1 family)
VGFGLKRRVIDTVVRAPIPVPDRNHRVVVLVYHSIHPSKGFADATPSLFSDHLAWLTEHCDLVPFESVLDARSSSPHERPTVALTFDDGYSDVHEYALPELTRLQLPATIFLTVGLIDGDEGVVRRMASLQQATVEDVAGLTWTQVKEIISAGSTVGSHGLAHVNLAEADDRTVTSEARLSKERIEEESGQAVACFAYPFGKPKHHVTPRTMRLVGSTGYTRAGTIHFRGVRPRDDPLAVPRFAITRDSLETLEAKVTGKLDFMGMYQAYAPVWAGRILSRRTSVVR